MSVYKILILMSASMILLFNHPLAMVIIIMMVSCMAAPQIFLMSKISLYSYILILAFLGGLLVIFVYISSLIPNEMMITKMKKMKMMLLIIMIPMFTENIISMTKINLMYSSFWYMIMILLMILLLIMMMVSMLIYNPFNPMKSA